MHSNKVFNKTGINVGDGDGWDVNGDWVVVANGDRAVDGQLPTHSKLAAFSSLRILPSHAALLPIQ